MSTTPTTSATATMSAPSSSATTTTTTHPSSSSSSSSSSSLLCSAPSALPTTLPNVNMATDWCVISSTAGGNGNVTSAVMQQCCDSAAVQSVGGCEWCYYQDRTAKNSGQFNEDFSACLRREAGVRGVEGGLTHYCNTPRLKGGTVGRSRVKGWVVAVVVGLPFALGVFA